MSAETHLQVPPLRLPAPPSWSPADVQQRLCEWEAETEAYAQRLLDSVPDRVAHGIRRAIDRRIVAMTTLLTRTAVEAALRGKKPWRDDEEFHRKLIAAIMPEAIRLIEEEVGLAKAIADAEYRLKGGIPS